MSMECSTCKFSPRNDSKNPCNKCRNHDMILSSPSEWKSDGIKRDNRSGGFVAQSPERLRHHGHYTFNDDE